MEKDYKQIEDLIVRFFEGATTNEEEKTLYAFFKQEDISDSLLPYKPVFDYFSMGMAEKVVETNGKKPKKIAFPKRWWTWSAGVAAFLLGLFFIQYSFHNTSDGFIEDGYIIRNGVRITDMKKIRSELEDSYNMAIAKYEDIERIKNEAAEKESLLNEMLQKEKHIYCKILCQIPEGYAREEVKRIIGID